jgi:hypothetical protein
MDPVQGAASRDHHLPPGRRAVHAGERNPHLEHWIAWLCHAADTADRMPAQIGESGGTGLAVEDHDTENVESGHRDRDVYREAVFICGWMGTWLMRGWPKRSG